MTQPQRLELTNNHHSKTEPLSFVQLRERSSSLRKFWTWTGFKEKKLWDVLQLLIVPTALAIGAFYLQESSKQRDLQIADDRAKQETLNRYFDQISTLLFERNLRTAKARSEARIVARARTLTALRELDGDRRSQLVKFLIEAELVSGRALVITLSNADLSDVDLRGRNLQGAVISWVRFDKANLRGADLRGAALNSTSFNQADLRGAKLHSQALQTALLCKTTMPDGKKSDRDCDKLKQRK